MAVYLVNYYLREEIDETEEHDEDGHHHHHHHEDYELIGNIKELGSWAHLMPTTFLVESKLSEKEIFEKLRPTIKEKDILFVSKLDGTSCACTIPEAVEWIETR